MAYDNDMSGLFKSLKKAVKKVVKAPVKIAKAVTIKPIKMAIKPAKKIAKAGIKYGIKAPLKIAKKVYVDAPVKVVTPLIAPAPKAEAYAEQPEKIIIKTEPALAPQFPYYAPQQAPQPYYAPQPAPQPYYAPQPQPQPAPQPYYVPQPAPQPDYAQYSEPFDYSQNDYSEDEYANIQPDDSYSDESENDSPFYESENDLPFYEGDNMSNDYAAMDGLFSGLKDKLKKVVKKAGVAVATVYGGPKAGAAVKNLLDKNTNREVQQAVVTQAGNEAVKAGFTREAGENEARRVLGLKPGTLALAGVGLVGLLGTAYILTKKRR